MSYVKEKISKAERQFIMDKTFEKTFQNLGSTGFTNEQGEYIKTHRITEDELNEIERQLRLFLVARPEEKHFILYVTIFTGFLSAAACFISIAGSERISSMVFRILISILIATIFAGYFLINRRASSREKQYDETRKQLQLLPPPYREIFLDVFIDMAKKAHKE